MNEDYLVNQINHLRAIIDEFENKSSTNNIYNIVNETIDETFWLADLNFRFNFVSKSIKKIIGYTYEELSGNSIENYLDKDSIKILKNKISEELKYIEKNPEKNSDYFERMILSFKHKNKDMSIWCEVKIRFLLDNQSKPISILGTAKDITEQKLIEESLYKKIDSDEKKISNELLKLKKELKKSQEEILELKLEINKLRNH